MATEEPIAAVEAPAPAEAGEEAAAGPAEPVDESYDESLLIVVKGKVKKPARPDDTERNVQVSKLQEQIDKASARMKEIKGILDARASGGKTVSPEQQAIRERIQAIRAEFDAVLVRGRRGAAASGARRAQPPARAWWGRACPITAGRCDGRCLNAAAGSLRRLPCRH